MNKEEILKLISVLIGNIKPIGDSSSDETVKNNLKLLISIMKELQLQIDEVAYMRNSPYASIKETAKIADAYLDWIYLDD